MTPKLRLFAAVAGKKGGAPPPAYTVSGTGTIADGDYCDTGLTNDGVEYFENANGVYLVRVSSPLGKGTVHYWYLTSTIFAPGNPIATNGASALYYWIVTGLGTPPISTTYDAYRTQGGQGNSSLPTLVGD